MITISVKTDFGLDKSKTDFGLDKSCMGQISSRLKIILFSPYKIKLMVS